MTKLESMSKSSKRTSIHEITVVFQKGDINNQRPQLKPQFLRKSILCVLLAIVTHCIADCSTSVLLKGTPGTPGAVDYNVIRDSGCKYEKPVFDLIVFGRINAGARDFRLCTPLSLFSL